MHLLYLTLSILLIALLSTPILAQPTGGLSERIGPVITSNTRTYFGLFPTIEQFESAAISARGDGGVDIVIARGGAESDTTVMLPDSVVRTLRRYIDTFELLFESDTNSIEWARLRDIVRPNNPIIDDPMVIVVTTRDGRTVRGAVIYGDERTLVLGPDSLLPDHGRLLRNLEAFGASEIDRLSDDRGFIGHLFSDIDVHIGGNDTLYRELIFPIVDRHRYYYAALSPETVRLVARKNETLAPSVPSVTVDAFDADRAPLPFHISLQAGAEIPMQKSFFPSAYRETMLRQEISKTPGTSYWCVGAEYSILEWLNLGAMFTTRGEARTDTTEDFEEYYGTALGFFVRGSIVRPELIFSDAFSRLNLGIGLGVELHQLTIDSRLRPISMDRHYNKFYREERSATGVLILLSCDYYLMRTFSLGLEMKLSIYPGLPVPRRELPNLAFPEIMAHEHEAHDLKLSSAYPLLAARFHF